MAAAYDYLTITLGRGRAAWQAFATYVNSPGDEAVARVGGEFVGLFAPQLGFASNEAAVLVRWPTGLRGSMSPLTGADGVVACHEDALTPTLRPRVGQELRNAGIYVHRWFVVDGDRVKDFVDLSGQAWGAFEGAYDTEIFGLFTTTPTPEDTAKGQGRLLLLTWYASHGVWEASREQAADPQSLFARRHELTRSTIGRSSILVPR
ncbi:MAG: hypothetical protein JWO83_1887 [Caulobacteraceae bacterium]|nr:hypothetical protein [Caulobacteraceae bacterium]